jgi:hypothetical protein
VSNHIKQHAHRDRPIRIGIDVFGGDHAPDAIL